ncbi:MAG TPA: sigma-70 family RNA polymerase sigma factor [Cyclobacteriaceae bacterium]|nr:sigma-70 family RNA polymerase sigma factor [Cyclobacteriaceae bacterium]
MVAGLKAHDKSFLDYLYDHYSGALYSVIFRVVRDEGVAQEVLQDAFLKIWNKIDAYDTTKGKLFTWMLNVTRNLAVDRTRSKEIQKVKKTDDIDLLVNRIDRQEQTESQVDAIGLNEMLNRLPEEQRFVIDHLYLKGFTQSELAEEFNIPLGTVKTRTRLGLNELRKILKG